MSNTTAILIYVAGIVIGSIGVGAYLRPGQRTAFDWTDYSMFTIIIILWPVLLAAIIGILIPGGLAIGAIYYVVKFLMWLGEGIGKGFDKWMYHRKVAREANADEEVGNG